MDCTLRWCIKGWNFITLCWVHTVRFHSLALALSACQLTKNKNFLCSQSKSLQSCHKIVICIDHKQRKESTIEAIEVPITIKMLTNSVCSSLCLLNAFLWITFKQFFLVWRKQDSAMLREKKVITKKVAFKLKYWQNQNFVQRNQMV